MGADLHPAWGRGEVLTDTRAFACQRELDRAERFGTNSSCRGAAGSTLSAGGTSAQLLEAGQWRSSAYRLYLDLGREESQEAAAILIEVPDVEPRAGQSDVHTHT